MKIIITDCDHANLDQEILVFNKCNAEYELKQCKTEEDLINQCKGYSIFINQYAPFTRKVIEALSPELKQVVRYGVGVNTIDLDAATEFGVQICNVPDYGMNEVADQAVGMMLALCRKIVLMNDYTKHEKWDYTKAIKVFRIPNQTVGIYGLGRIGKTFAKRMGGFGVKLIACDPIYKVGDVINGATIVDFDTLLKQSDVLSIHAPFDETTKHAFSLESIKKMKPTAFLINVSRGGIIEEEGLYTALTQNVIAGAALDVVEVEPMEVGSKLFALDNFIVSPHMAWYSEESALELKTKVAEEACRFLNNEQIHYPVNNINK
ncbi:dehydrogenase [Candidatus Epulonipiscium fishelsonii]|uniref:Dehydrogenase n=1 Tax=Candidatus Epulonipiscium fishelsonii TaxID=77094 RepID=A0ACC8X9L5_9FIRM|nr:dehydrogenase [Epulopiscium sp. SCG-B11WGA-EpuloA1]ONI41871.1 dehydrogenase [Epulopiscium sp. SCG-B05WGA-EpuloA1]